MGTSPVRRVLVCGASVAGPALAYWLHRRGCAVTVVEKAGAVRGGGYPIDVRGTALDVVERMGLLPRLRDADIDTRLLTFLDADGAEVAAVRPEELTGGVRGHDVELPRGDLTALLYGAVRDDVEFRFGDHATALREHGAGVDVTFASGAEGTFDVVVGADGLHSGTRELAFGPEERFHHYLGHCFAGFTLPDDLGLDREGVAWTVPGRGAALYAVAGSERLHGFLVFRRSDPPLAAFRDPAAQRDLVAAAFAGDGWEVPRLVAAMRAADDLYFDVVSQIRMPRWSSGRVGLVGDAAYAPSFLSGQGTSAALVGAYVLAGELAAGRDHTATFAAYENALRGFVAANQALADRGRSGLAPETAEQLAARNEALRALATGGPSALAGGPTARAATAISLPDHALPGKHRGR